MWRTTAEHPARTLDAMITNESPCCVCTSGFVWAVPHLAPVWLTRIIGALANVPVTLPALARIRR